ncbi:MAG TPA: phosphopantetheine-binding protein [Thermoanaerobaculia bacterium]|nr:phosphopantetheine-binding protein [Thermoanaerobaculia bacterium]
MHGRESVGARVAAILADRLNIDAVPVEADLFAAAALDSLGLVELLLGLEDEFGINISADDLELDRFRSISSIATFVASKLEPRNGHDVDLAVRRIAG